MASHGARWRAGASGRRVALAWGKLGQGTKKPGAMAGRRVRYEKPRAMAGQSVSYEKGQ